VKLLAQINKYENTQFVLTYTSQLPVVFPINQPAIQSASPATQATDKS